MKVKKNRSEAQMAMELICDDILKRKSLADLEEFFGISIKKSGRDETDGIDLYNVYDKTGNLILARTSYFWMSQVMKELGCCILDKMFSEAKNESEEAEKHAQEIENKRQQEAEKCYQEEMEERKKGMEQCPVCFGYYPKGTHLHGW